MSAALSHGGIKAGPTPAIEALGLASPAVQLDIERAIAGFHLKLAWESGVELFAARVERACPELLLIDTDVLGCAADLCRVARSLRPDVKVFGISCYWSDRDEALVTCVDTILHKPARRAQWEAAFDRMGLLRMAL
jgi:hypothetical protein